MDAACRALPQSLLAQLPLTSTRELRRSKQVCHQTVVMTTVKVADHVDATGELVGRRIVLTNMPEVERLETSFSEHVSHKSECSLFRCIDDTWRSVAVLVRSLFHAHVRTSRCHHDTDHDKRNRWCRGTDFGADCKTMNN